MATKNNLINGTMTAVERKIPGMLELVEKTVLFSSTFTLDAGDKDVAPVIIVPEKTWVFNSWIRVMSKCPSNSTVDLGYGSDVDCWGAGLPLDTVGDVAQKAVEQEDGNMVIFNNRAPLANIPRYFEDADTIDIKATTDIADVDISSGEIKVYAWIWRV